MSVPVPPSLPDEPLALTVHSLPSVQALAPAAARRTWQGRVKMLVVMLICAAPVVASYFTYYVVRPEARRNFGELINPQRPLPALAAQDLQGQTQNLQSLNGQWLLLSVAPAACETACQNNLYWSRQLRESMGKEMDRVDRVWLVSDAEPIQPKLQAALQGATVLRVPAADLAAWLTPAAGRTLVEHIFVVDPLGNWMMRFPAGMDLAAAAKAKRDLDRLLRASASWDEPGRAAAKAQQP